ncbi:hypothetical protein O7616_21690 [Micromonospora sp. WMMD964]|nr:hypothetical protein [Micromonospora sp. WMMD964]WFE99491.1 hypothetical protein O7616_21690 [Micromonospora sp. WMMD964]
MVLALLLGLAAGWLLRGRRGGQGSSIVDGDPVAGLAVISTPTPAATTDEPRPAAAVDPAPTAVADEPVPVDTVSAPAAVTATDDHAPTPVPAEAPSTVDPGDMALTEPPPPVPSAESDANELRPEPAVESTPEPVAADEQRTSATVVAPRRPADDLPPANATPIDTTPADTTPADTTPADEPVGAVSAAEPVAATDADDRIAADPAHDAEATPSSAEPAVVTTDAAHTDPVDAHHADAEPVTTDSANAEPVAADPVDAEVARPAVATPPVRPAAATSPAAEDTDITGYPGDPTGPADDFRRIQGIGPKMAAALQDAGVRTYGQLGDLDEPALRDLIRAAGLRAAPGLASWPQQARVLAGAADEMAAALPNGNQA